MSALGLKAEVVAARLQGLRALGTNAAWRELLLPLIEQRRKEALGRATDPAAPAEERAAHAHCFRLLAELAGSADLGIAPWLVEQLALYEEEGRALNEAHAKKQGGRDEP